jgi:hypothetical protein
MRTSTRGGVTGNVAGGASVVAKRPVGPVALRACRVEAPRDAMGFGSLASRPTLDDRCDQGVR